MFSIKSKLIPSNKTYTDNTDKVNKINKAKKINNFKCTKCKKWGHSENNCPN